MCVNTHVCMHACIHTHTHTHTHTSTRKKKESANEEEEEESVPQLLEIWKIERGAKDTQT